MENTTGSKRIVDYFGEKVMLLDVETIIQNKEKYCHDDKYGNLFYDFVCQKYNIIRDNRSFSLGVTETKYGSKLFFTPKIRYIPNLMYNLNGRYLKVIIQNYKCEHCDWEGIIANPFSYEFFMFLEDKDAAENIISKIEGEKCPICKNKITRTALWLKSN